MKKSAKQGTLPKLPAEQIKKYLQNGKWPPPEGVIVLTEIPPSQEDVDSLLDNLAKVLPTQKSNIIEKAKKKTQKKVKKD